MYLHRSARRSSCLPAIAGAALIVGSLGCAPQTDALQKDLATLRTELAGLRAENAALGERMDALEIKSGSLKGYEPPKPASTDDTDRPDLQVVKLTPNAGKDDAPPPDDGPRTIIRTTSKGTIVEETVDPKAPSTEAAAGDFAKAKEQFDKKSWGDALTSFTSFMVKYPDHPKLLDATYYAGNCAYQKGDYTNAVDLLRRVAEASPAADKAPDALYDLGRAYEKLGEKDKAADARKRLKADYPKSAAAKRLNS
ncbi:MAG: tetratricopeptide repeat protein [Polyangiaceae bacterium]